MAASRTSTGRARRRHRHDRRRAQHRGQGARGPRLLRRRQPAAEPAARRGPAGRREPGHRAADRGRGRRALRLVLRSPCQANLAQGATGRHATLVFLEATDDVLVRRQEAARRPHPLQGSGRLLDGLQREREVLADLRSDADLVIDTTDLNVHQLTDRIAEAFGTPDAPRLKVTVVSFGFKYGIPVDADFVADMRFLPNPFWVPELRPHTGRDATVADYVKSQPGAAEFLDGYVPVLESVAEGYLREGKRFMTVAIGCTGGKHRSVAMTEEIAAPARAHGLRRPRHPPRPRAGVTARMPPTRPVGRRPRRRPRTARLAARPAAARRRPRGRRADRGRHGRRQRRLVGSAARRVRGAAARRPADGARRAVRRRRVGPHLGAGRPAPLRR